MDRMILALPFAISLFVGMVICLELGRRLGTRTLARDPQGGVFGLGVVEGAVFGLYGLLLAFTFSGAYLRLDLLPADSQLAMRKRFREYVDSRLEVYRRNPYIVTVKAELSKSAKIQMEIWAQAVSATRLPAAHPDAAKLLLPALNTMIDVTTTRTMAIRTHPPWIIFGLLFVLALVCSLLAGFGTAGSKQRSWLHVTAFAAITVISVYVILDIEYPRVGLVRLDAYDSVLIELRDSMQ
jgi:amino acid transporter